MFSYRTQFYNNINKGGDIMEIRSMNKPESTVQGSDRVERSKSWSNRLLVGSLVAGLAGCSGVTVENHIPLPASPQSDGATTESSQNATDARSGAGSDSIGPSDASRLSDGSPVSSIDGGTELDGGAGTDSNQIGANEADGGVTDDSGATNGTADGGAGAINGADANYGPDAEQIGGTDSSVASDGSGTKIDGAAQSDGAANIVDAENESGNPAVDGSAIADGVAAEAGLDSNGANDASGVQLDAHLADTHVEDATQDSKLNACSNQGAGEYRGDMSTSVPVSVGPFTFEFEGTGATDGTTPPAKISIKCGDQSISPPNDYQIGVESVLYTIDNKRISITPYNAGVAGAFVDIKVEELAGQDGGVDAGVTRDARASEAGICADTTGSYKGFVNLNDSAQAGQFTFRYEGMFFSDGGQVATIGVANGSGPETKMEFPVAEATSFESAGKKITVTPSSAGRAGSFLDIQVDCI
jgi:hypothetical protein